MQIARDDQSVVVEGFGKPDQALDGALDGLIRRPLDVAASPLRVTLLELAPDDVVLVIQLYHLVVDDWALAILEREFTELYCARGAGRPASDDHVPDRSVAVASACPYPRGIRCVGGGHETGRDGHCRAP